MADTVVFSVRMTSELKARLEAVAEGMERPRSWVVNHAIQQYVDEQSWQIEAIKKGVDSADRGETLTHDDVIAKWERRLADRLDKGR